MEKVSGDRLGWNNKKNHLKKHRRIGPGDDYVLNKDGRRISTVVFGRNGEFMNLRQRGN